jgi:hypothetical protein
MPDAWSPPFHAASRYDFTKSPYALLSFNLCKTNNDEYFYPLGDQVRKEKTKKEGDKIKWQGKAISASGNGRHRHVVPFTFCDTVTFV